MSPFHTEQGGNFVKPGVESFEAAGAAWTQAQDFYLLMTGSPADDAYPIAATAFIRMH